MRELNQIVHGRLCVAGHPGQNAPFPAVRGYISGESQQGLWEAKYLRQNKLQECQSFDLS